MYRIVQQPVQSQLQQLVILEKIKEKALKKDMFESHFCTGKKKIIIGISYAKCFIEMTKILS